MAQPNLDLIRHESQRTNKTKTNMVLFLNLDSSKSPPHNSSRGLPTAKPQQNPNITHPFTALLSSYPLLISLAKHLDLGDLATLSNTCHPFRSLLLPQRENLTSTSLVCKNSGQQQPRRCVKDLVNECKGCLKPVCRVRSPPFSPPYNSDNANGRWAELRTKTEFMGTIIAATPLVLKS